MSAWIAPVAFTALALCACNASPPDGVFACAENADCPAAYFCHRDNYCYAHAEGGGHSPSDAGPANAGPGADAAPPDAAIDAGPDAAIDAGPDAAIDAGPDMDGATEAGFGEGGSPEDAEAGVPPKTYTIKVTKLGTGSGSVSADGAAIDCGSTCSAMVDKGTVVTLTAMPDKGSLFGNWAGPCGNRGTCTFTVDADVDVTATFPLDNYTLIVGHSGAGAGTVTSTPAGIDCGDACAYSFGQSASVTLTATADTGSSFTGWSGAGCSGTGSCTVSLDATEIVTAGFALQSVPLTITASGNGAGSVTSLPAGIDCGASCSAVFDYGTSVTLSAQPGAHSELAGWSGSGCSGTGSCVVTLTAATSVTASFALQKYQLTVAKSGAGSGSVSSGDNAIACGSTCSASYDYGTTVALSANAGGSDLFGGWSGAGCGGTGGCTVLMQADTSVDAKFVPAFNYVFVSQPTFTANSGVAAADAICQSEAESAQLPGTYKAWLSTSSVSAVSRLGTARGWLRADGKPFADRSSDFVNADSQATHVYYPISLSATGQDLGASDVYTGTFNDGTATSMYTCSNWTSSSMSGYATSGSPTAGSSGFTNYELISCNGSLPVFCFGTSQANPLPAITPATGRKAFVTKGFWVSGGGIASADAMCQSEATAAGLSGTFKALLATTSASAASRFSTNGATWVRPDGLALAASAATALASNTLYWDVPNDRPADNSAQYDEGLWSGAATAPSGTNPLTVPGTSASTCQNWTSSASADTGYSGTADESKLEKAFVFYGVDTTPVGCDATFNKLACLQQ